MSKPTASIIHHFSQIDDPGVNRQKKHQLQDIFFITLCAVVCGADNRVAIEEFGKAKQDWFTDLPGLENGIPSHDTLGDVFAAIETNRFSQCFSNWMADPVTLTDGEVIAIDGKCLRRSIDGASKKAVISIDAMGCQTKIAKQIIGQEADYVLSLKGNQGSLHEDVAAYFTSNLSPEVLVESYDGGHGRIETRSLRASDDISWLKERHS